MAVWYWQCMRCMKESHDKEMAATLSDSVRTLERLLRSPARHNKNSERCPEEAPPKNRPWRPGDKSAPPLCAAKFLVTTVVQTLSPICARMHCLVRSENEHFATGTAFSSINNSQTLPILLAFRGTQTVYRMRGSSSRSKPLHSHTTRTCLAAGSLNILLRHSGLT